MSNQTNNKSFILHNDSLEILDKLDDAQAGKLFKAIKFYQKHKQLPQLDFTLDLVFTPFLNQFKRDEEKYQNIVERNKINGSKGGRPKNPVGYLETQENPRKPKKAYSDSKSKNDSKNDSDSDNKNDLPSFINRDLFNSFAEMRKKIKKPLTDKAKELLIRKLTEFENKQAGFANKALENSIESSWQGVFEPRQNNHNNQQKTTESFDKSKWEQYV